ncbi:hypothetical protein HPB50_019983 [Hyalomma asiaticum]|uniref:Uncharacterized protein n=1 Tax=Hyalomma asiaticum TaxID=266040 RepID=A0ACB7S7T5_HYAAI|nr:hypothetical protein HPB50_019983 [Hyalomma asiaticum]
MEQIEAIERPVRIPKEGLICDLLLSDPEKSHKGWQPSDRGVSHTFGLDVLEEFLERHHLQLVCRGHQVVEDGYEFFGKRRLVTIFSAPNYCGQFDNAGAIMNVDENLTCSFMTSEEDPPTSGRQTKEAETPSVKGAARQCLRTSFAVLSPAKPSSSEIPC